MSNITPINPWPFVCLGIPCGDRVHTPFMYSMWAIGRQYPGKMGLIMGHSSMIVNARNQVVDMAQQLKAEYLLFLDSDMTFPQDTPKRLLAHDKDIVCATYVRRGPPFDLLGHGPSGEVLGGLVEMTHIPTGCMLTKMSVFDKFTKPEFRFAVDEKNKITHGEDFVFSEMAREKGFKLWCDMDLTKEIGHCYQYEVKHTPELAKAQANG